MIASLRIVWPLIIISILIIYEFRISVPSCKVVPGTAEDEEEGRPEEEHLEDLKVMLVANLLLMGSEAGIINLIFREYLLTKFFRKSFGSLRPDMLLVLGDTSAKGFSLNRSTWSSVLHQFHRVLGPFRSLPFHVVLGDRDIGDCSGLDPKSVDWIASSFPGLDSSGCGAFEISNISFVSLNTVALLCSNSKLRFSVEKVVESESTVLQMEREQMAEPRNGFSKIRYPSSGLKWRETSISSGSGPVLLLHFPLHRTANSCWEGNASEDTFSESYESSKTSKSRRIVGLGPYDLPSTLPMNATEYIFQALRPRIVFSAHTRTFCDHVHSDGTREITVPAMSWDANSEPGFVFVTFRRNGRAVIVRHCSVAKELHVLYSYSIILFVLMINYVCRKHMKFY